MLRMSAPAGGAAELAAWSATERLPLERRAPTGPTPAPGACTCGVDHPVGAYNEEAFHYLLAIEEKRFERTHRPFVLALIEHANGGGEPQRMTASLGAKIVTSLARSLRETDVIGWYREGCVVGALLTHLGDGALVDVSRLMSGKIARALREGLTERVADRLTLKLYQPFEDPWS